MNTSLNKVDNDEIATRVAVADLITLDTEPATAVTDAPVAAPAAMADLMTLDVKPATAVVPAAVPDADLISILEPVAAENYVPVVTPIAAPVVADVAKPIPVLDEPAIVDAPVPVVPAEPVTIVDAPVAVSAATVSAPISVYVVDAPVAVAEAKPIPVYVVNAPVAVAEANPIRRTLSNLSNPVQPVEPIVEVEEIAIAPPLLSKDSSGSVESEDTAIAPVASTTAQTVSFSLNLILIHNPNVVRLNYHSPDSCKNNSIIIYSFFIVN